MRLNHSFHLQLFVTGAVIFVFCFSTIAQDIGAKVVEQENENYSINWVSEYPITKSKKKKKKKENNISDVLLGEDNKGKKSRNNNNWFSNLIFGKKASGLVKPMSVIAINPDTFWIADQGTGSILKVFNGVGDITQHSNKAIDNIPSIVGSCFMPNNKILFTDSKLNKVFQLIPDKKELRILNDSLFLEQPTGIAYSVVNKQIWVVETKAHRISVLTKSGELIKQIGERGIAPGQFNFPTYIWIDDLGTVYVVDAMNFRIQIFDKNGEFISLFGKIGDASGYLTRPKGVATDSYGHIYIADALFHVVQVFDRKGKLLSAFGSQGQDKEQFWMPTGIYIDDKDYIYIADSYNSRIQIFQLVTED